ncbi:MAG: hypothetical protein WCP53_02785, partial [Verrucomicrobiota bacterium]
QAFPSTSNHTMIGFRKCPVAPSPAEMTHAEHAGSGEPIRSDHRHHRRLGLGILGDASSQLINAADSAGLLPILVPLLACQRSELRGGSDRGVDVPRETSLPSCDDFRIGLDREATLGDVVIFADPKHRLLDSSGTHHGEESQTRMVFKGLIRPR